jgi:hypothetical protein
MLVISKFHDYYDSALSTGVDKTVVYNRKTVELDHVPDMFKELSDNLINLQRELEYHYECAYIGFCGKIYPIITHTYNGKSDSSITTLDVAETTKSLTKITHRDYKISDEWEASYIKTKLRDFFNIENKSCYKDYFLDNKVVCFSIKPSSKWRNKSGMEINPCLRDFKFEKIIDPYTALQSIMMYISGVLGSPNEQIIQISDKDQIVSKGFDTVTSFRKAPSGKKKR